MLLLVKKSEYARLKGWTPQYITKLIGENRIVLSPDGKRVDVSASDALLEKGKSVDREGLREYHAAQREEKGVAPQPALPLYQPPADDGESEQPGAAAAPQAPSNPHSDKFNEGRALKAMEDAELAKMERMRRQNLLVEVESVKKGATKIGAMLGRALDDIPARVGAKWAGEPDPNKRIILLETQMRRIREELAHEIEEAFGITPEQEPPA